MSKIFVSPFFALIFIACQQHRNEQKPVKKIIATDSIIAVLPNAEDGIIYQNDVVKLYGDTTIDKKKLVIFL